MPTEEIKKKLKLLKKIPNYILYENGEGSFDIVNYSLEKKKEEKEG